MPRLATLLALALIPLAACAADDSDRTPGQTSFVSAPPNGGNAQGESGGADEGATPGAGSGSGTVNPGTNTRDVEETDLYRLEGNRLYYLNSYRGLMVFDVTNPDQPKLL